MAEKLTERAYAKHRGCARSTVQSARERGRLRESITRGPNGEILIDVELADQEWQAWTDVTRQPLTGRTAPRRPAADTPAAPAEVVSEVTGRLAEIIAAHFEEERRMVLALAPHAVRGAIEALAAAGRAPTTAALVAALGLEPPDPGVGVVCDLRDIVRLGDRPGLASEQAHRIGREAALGGGTR